MGNPAVDDSKNNVWVGSGSERTVPEKGAVSMKKLVQRPRAPPLHPQTLTWYIDIQIHFRQPFILSSLKVSRN